MLTTPPNCDINYATELKTGLASCFAGNQPKITVTLSGTERMSLACVQVLAAAKEKAEKKGIRFEVIPSDAAGKIFCDLGFEDILAANKESA